MTKRIDHVAEAQQFIAGLSGGYLIPEMVEQTLSTAQVHATLALVEQQRIANLIALANSTHEHLRDQVAEDAADTLTEFHTHEMGGYFAPSADARAALGISDHDDA